MTAEGLTQGKLKRGYAVRWRGSKSMALAITEIKSSSRGPEECRQPHTRLQSMTSSNSPKSGRRGTNTRFTPSVKPVNPGWRVAGRGCGSRTRPGFDSGPHQAHCKRADEGPPPDPLTPSSSYTRAGKALVEDGGKPNLPKPICLRGCCDVTTVTTSTT
ncbi:hypothetical protein B0H11DRAFT_1912202 [Mycena galericulata]|nr:hypothetical protein B0H11DRAFT_1912202 [Mycena galericulata]